MSLPSHISQVVKSLSFHIPEARKKVPLSDGAPWGITNFTVSLECSDLQSANSSWSKISLCFMGASPVAPRNEELDLHETFSPPAGDTTAKKCKLGENQGQRW